jgi:hypothetical protein
VPNVVNKQSSTAQGKFANSVYDFIAEIMFLGGLLDGAPGPPAKKTDAHYDDRVKATLNDVMTKDPEEFDDTVTKLVKGIMYFVTDLDRRKVGKSLSFSKPGKGVDVLLGAS